MLAWPNMKSRQMHSLWVWTRDFHWNSPLGGFVVFLVCFQFFGVFCGRSGLSFIIFGFARWRGKSHFYCFSNLFGMMAMTDVGMHMFVCGCYGLKGWLLLLLVSLFFVVARHYVVMNMAVTLIIGGACEKMVGSFALGFIDLSCLWHFGSGVV
ncbi:unnamed protein product [Cuscuta epithymum]|uniref:Transmembrane protein n=1 Tax=Cuscuta epithymum TaxID=186058 RepID=A0AAV0CBT1_9ASTE|nr:unnamed protein product [Cuscuta epithymum]